MTQTLFIQLLAMTVERKRSWELDSLTTSLIFVKHALTNDFQLFKFKILEPLKLLNHSKVYRFIKNVNVTNVEGSL